MFQAGRRESRQVEPGRLPRLGLGSGNPERQGGWGVQSTELPRKRILELHRGSPLSIQQIANSTHVRKDSPGDTGGNSTSDYTGLGIRPGIDGKSDAETR